MPQHKKTTRGCHGGQQRRAQHLNNNETQTLTTPKDNKSDTRDLNLGSARSPQGWWATRKYNRDLEQYRKDFGTALKPPYR